jgi:hypothetical protein
MELPITCDSKRRLEYVSLKELNTFQGELVELSKEGYQSMKDSLTRYGFFMPIFYWTDPVDGLRKVIDGHQRKRVLEREGWTVKGGKFPVVDVEAKSEQEAAEKLLQMRGNHGKVTEQGLYEFLATKGVDLASIPNPDIPYIDINQFTQNYYTDPLDLESEDGEEVETHGIHAFNEEAIFEGDNLWDIPDLREDRLVTELPDDLGTWLGTPGETAIDKVVNQNTIYRKAFDPEWARDAFMCFYEDDANFERIWADAVAMVEKYHAMGWKGIVGPDFTMYGGDPTVIQLYNIYRNRWCARYWQEAGLNIIPNIELSDTKTYDWVRAGIPRPSPVVAVQCRTNRRTKDRRAEFIANITAALDDLQPEQCIIYGGEDHEDWLSPRLPQHIKYHYLTSWIEGRFKKYRKGEIVSPSAPAVAAAQ